MFRAQYHLIPIKDDVVELPWTRKTTVKFTLLTLALHVPTIAFLVFVGRAIKQADNTAPLSEHNTEE